jgi:hypothetical protein
LRHGRDLVLVLQTPIGLFDGVDADLQLFAQPAQGGQAVALFERAVFDQMADAQGNLLIPGGGFQHGGLLANAGRACLPARKTCA